MHDAGNRVMEKELASWFGESSDFIAETVVFGVGKAKAYYFRSLVDFPQTLAKLAGNPDDILSASQSHRNADLSADSLAAALLQGKLVLFRPDGQCDVLEPARPNLYRTVETPENENPIQSSLDAFGENLDQNIGLLRGRLRRKNLIVDIHAIGAESPRRIAVIYLKGTARTDVVRRIGDRLTRNGREDVCHVMDLLRVLGQPRFSLVPTYVSTELPGDAAISLLHGKVLVLMDHHPFAIGFPAIVSDLWSTKTDVNYPNIQMLFFRTIRIIGILFTLVMPGLYIVLNAVNPELLRIQLALAVAQSREGVPYPAIIEVLLMMLLMEMLIEASIRLPKNIGPTITTIGGIILGQAIVEAKLVSNLLIIILAASTIANFTMSGYLNTVGIRIYKFATLFLSSVFGIFGLELAILWLFAYFAGLRSFGVSYLSLSAKGSDPNE